MCVKRVKGSPMKNGQVPAADQQVRDAITALLKEREAHYGWVWLRTFFCRDPNTDKWRHGVTRIEILQKGGQKPEELLWHYERGILRQIALTQEAFTGIVDALVERGRLAVPGMPPTEISGGFSWNEYLHSKAMPLGFPWAGNYYAFREEAYVGLPGGPLLALSCPAFTDSYTLVEEQIGIDPRRQVGFHILLPNYLARIETLRIGPRGLTIVVTPQGIGLGGLLGKVHVKENRGGRTLHRDCIFDEKTLALSLDFPPGEVYVGLLSKEAGQLLDFRRFHAASLESSAAAPDVESEPLVEEEIEAAILQGENDQVEFKLTLAEGGDLAETIVAFANGKGGIILVGVDDKANVKGLDGRDPENTIRNVVRRYCDPSIDPAVEMAEVRGRSVLAIRVREGSDKPYIHREKGVVVRYGSTDRIPLRDELDSIFAEKERAREPFYGKGT